MRTKVEILQHNRLDAVFFCKTLKGNKKPPIYLRVQ